MESHFFENRLYSTVRRILTVLLLIIVSFGIVFFLIKYNRIKSEIENNTVHILEKSIEKELNAKMSKTHSALQISNSPTKEDSISERTMVSADTIVKKMIVIGNKKDAVSDSFLSYLQISNQLHTDTLNLIFQNNLNDNGILATSFVLLRYDDKTEISGDTVNYPISFRTPVLQRGFFDEITFQGLIHYTPLTIIKMIPRYLFYIFIFLICLISFSLFYLSKKSNAIQPNKIMKLKNGDYYIGRIYFNKDKKMLRSNNKTVNLPSQLAGILQFFLDSEEFTASKEELQNKFWQSTTSYNSMTSAMNKLRTHLKDIDSTFTINTSKGSDFYNLEYGD